MTLAGLANLGGEYLEVSVCFGERVLAFQLGTKCDLQKLGSGEAALLQLLVEIFGQVHLNAGHAPNCTQSSSARPADVNGPKQAARPSENGTSALGQVLKNVRSDPARL